MTVLEHLLTCPGEEGVEVSKDTSKALRFGLDDTNFLKPDGPNNRQNIIDELNDILGVAELCVIHGILPADWQNQAKQEAKKRKVYECMAYARKTGALIDG